MLTEMRPYANFSFFYQYSALYSFQAIGAPPGWLSDECVGLMTWWLRVRSPVEAYFRLSPL